MGFGVWSLNLKLVVQDLGVRVKSERVGWTLDVGMIAVSVNVMP